MERRIRLECLECGCAIEVPSNSFRNINCVECPCCKNMLYGDGFEQFKNALMNGGDLPENLPGTDRDVFTETRGFLAFIQTAT